MNPKHSKRIIIDVFTSTSITKEEFENELYTAILRHEVQLNETTPLRWHVKELVDVPEPRHHPGTDARSHPISECKERGCK